MPAGPPAVKRPVAGSSPASFWKDITMALMIG
jgi:hypothetical protein